MKNNDKIYEKAVKDIQTYVKNNPQCTRMHRFRILQAVIDVDEETARKVGRYMRAIRATMPKDSRGAELEESWKKPKYLHEWEYENKKIQESLI
jgi:hypothetical protein